MSRLKDIPILVLAALLTLAAAALLPADALADSIIGGREGAAAGQMSPAGKLAVSQKEGGDVYVADSGNQRVDQFEPDGIFVRAFGWGVRDGSAELQQCTSATGCRAGLEGSGAGQFRGPSGIAVDNDPASPSYGDVYVTDAANFRIEKFGPAGEFILMFGGGVDQGPHHPGDLCTAAYLTEGDSCGAGSPGTGPSHFYESPVHIFGTLDEQSWREENSIAVGPDGSLYVGDFRRIQHFSAEGAYQGELSLPGAALVGSLAVDSSGHVFANALPVNERQKVDLPASGTYTLTFEGQTTEPIPYNVAPNSALEKLSSVGKGNVSTQTNSGVLQVTFQGALAHADLPQMTASNATVETLREGAQGGLVELAGFAAAQPSEVLHTLDTEEPTAEPLYIALDSSGDLFVADLNGAASEPPTGEFRFRAFRPDGSLYAEFGSEAIKENVSEFGSFTKGVRRVESLAVDPASGELFAANNYYFWPDPRVGPFEQFAHVVVVSPPAEGAPTITGEEAPQAETRPIRTTLKALLNPRGYETKYRFEYIAAKRCEENEAAGHPCFEGAAKSAERGLGSIVIRDDPVQATIESLLPATRYRFRLLAENEVGLTEGERDEAGEEIPQSFETPPVVQVRNLVTQTVGPELVTLSFELNNENSLLTGHYRIQLGPDNHEGTLPAAGGSFQAGEATFTGLLPNTTYQYRLTAENEFGATETTDAALTTEPSAAEERQAEDCPENGTVHGQPHSARREEDDSTALPDCRAYEQVSERNKQGGQAFPPNALAPSGERVLYTSLGVFAGATVNEATVLYLAHRTPTGWLTQPVLARPPGEPATQPTTTANELDFSPELDRWLFGELPAFDDQEGFHFTKSFYLSLGLADGSYQFRASPEINVLEGKPDSWFSIAPFRAPTLQSYTSESLERMYFATNRRLLPAPADERPDDSSPSGYGRFISTFSDRIYELAGLGGADPTLSLVAELPPGLQTVSGAEEISTGCGIDQLRGGRPGDDPLSDRLARLVSTDGATIVFSMPIEEQAGAKCGEGTPNPFGLFVHHAGNAGSLRIDSPPPAQCHSPHLCSSTPQSREAQFTGLSPDGRLAWFTTDRPLIDSDADQTGDLYLAKLGPEGELAELVQASAGEATPSHPTPGQGAGVLRAYRVSPDGSRVAFVATGVLTSDENSAHQSAAPGAKNLYIYDAQSGHISFVARFGESEEEEFRSIFSEDGRYLVFTSRAGLVPGDTDGVADIYRYDSQTGTLLRLSVGRDGNAADGNDGIAAELPSGSSIDEPNNYAEDSTRAIGAGGKVVVFETASPLVSSDTNHARDIYEWEEAGYGSCTQEEGESGGCVRLISDGLSPEGSSHAVISASGRDITFQTQRGELPWDTDGVGDIYDAREAGGFPRPAEPEVPCAEGSAESCHGESTHESLAPSYTSQETRHGPEAEAGRLQCAKGKHRVKKHGEYRCVPNHKHRHAHHRQKRARPNRGASR